MRGRKSKVGDTRVAPNGYHYTCTTEGWELTHRLVAGTARGYPVTPDERVSFKDKDKTNLDPSNLIVTPVRGSSLEKKKAKLEARIEDLQRELQEVVEEIELNSKSNQSQSA